jgi:hypothetical protein
MFFIFRLVFRLVSTLKNNAKKQSDEPEIVEANEDRTQKMKATSVQNGNKRRYGMKSICFFRFILICTLFI